MAKVKQETLDMLYAAANKLMELNKRDKQILEELNETEMLLCKCKFCELIKGHLDLIRQFLEGGK